MKEVKGKYGTAKIFTDLVDEKSIEQVKTLMDQEFVKDCKVRMMPDIHAGAGCVIGTTMEIRGRVCPNLTGVDIGCGMLCAKLYDEEIDLVKLDEIIHKHIPAGFNKRDKIHRYFTNTGLSDLGCIDHVDLDNAAYSLGTLGGGNHFIEIDKDDNGNLYLVIHTGSRHLGLEVAKFYQNWAESSIKADYDSACERIINELKDAGRHSEISSELQKFKSSYIIPPKELSSFSGFLFKNYIHDMKIVQQYAMWNRMAILDVICEKAGLEYGPYFHTVHNYIDTDNMILRKGAVSAKDGEKLLIPMNMRDGSLICIGKGNPDWNYSAPHGAGRLMSRTEARTCVSLTEFAKSMDGIFSSTVGFDTLDECPMAYKPMESIVNNIGDTVDILKVIKPVYNFKASE